jgi:RNA polymerase sigma-70 factor (ECF subfamily)
MASENKQKEFGAIIDKFSRFIGIHINKYNLHKYGLDSDDILQEVKIKIWKILHDEKKIENYASYIKKIVDSSIIDQLRKIKRDEGLFSYEKNKRISEQNYHYLYEFYPDYIIKEKISKAVDSLIESRRKVVKLYLLNMTIEEIAIYLKWTKDKTRNLLYRGLIDLRKRLKDIEIENENKSK